MRPTDTEELSLAGKDEPVSSREYLMRTYGDAPVTFVRGVGTELFDAEGRRYLDFLSGLAVTSLGHCHQAVSQAIALQAATLVHVSNLFGNELAPQVASMLDRLIGGGVHVGGQVFFANSGAEANECAIKLARRYGGWGRYAVISAYGSFHGRTLATLHATGQPSKHEGFQPLPEGFRHVAYADPAAIEEAIRPDVAAVLLEAIQGEGGIIEPPSGYLSEVRRICDKTGVLLIIDEVQTGLGRTGKWFAFHHDKVQPDIVTVAKALGNGFPVGACWARKEVASGFQPGDHATTFGGQPLAMAAARATLQVMIDEDIPSRAAEMGELLSGALAGLDGVVAVRGKGLLLGAVLGKECAKQVAGTALELGLVVNAVAPGVVRLAPPLTATKAEIREGLELLAAAIGAVLSKTENGGTEGGVARGTDERPALASKAEDDGAHSDKSGVEIL